MCLNFHLNDFSEKLALWKLHVRKTVKILRSYPENRRSQNLPPKGRLNWRKGGECFAPCICFAQLRAEMSENDAREARRSSEIVRICYSHDFLISSFFGVFKCFGWYVFDQCPAQGSCQRHRNNAIEFSFERLFSKVRPLKMICWKKCRNSMLIPTES